MIDRRCWAAPGAGGRGIGGCRGLRRGIVDKGTADRIALGGIADEDPVGYGLVTGPDGKSYEGTFRGGHFFVYDPGKQSDISHESMGIQQGES